MEPRDIFLNQHGRLRSGWRFLIFAVLFRVGMRLTLSIYADIAVSALGNDADAFLHSAVGNIVEAVILLALAILLGWGCGRLLEGLPLRALGWSFRGRWLRDWLMGSLVGAASLALATLIALACRGFSFRVNEGGLSASVVDTLVLSGLVFILLAALEEAIFRGYPLQTMTRARLAWVAVIITAVIFSWGHLNNPNAVPGFTFVNTALAGVWLAIAYLRTRNLWFPLGIHWSWNWTMSAVFGIPVSGITRIAPDPLLRATDLGPAWLTGGNYGIEGGTACIVALLVSIIFVWRTRLVSADEEMLRMTGRENPESRIQNPEEKQNSEVRIQKQE